MTESPPPTLSGSEPLDELDTAIFSLLESDGRRSYRDMATELEVPEATVRFRVNRLLRSQLMHITAMIRPQQLGGTLATLFVRVSPPHEADVTRALIAMDDVPYVSRCLGDFGLLLQVRVANVAELDALIRHRIGALPGVLDVQTRVELEVLKAKYGMVGT